MAEHNITERYGVRLVSIDKVWWVAFPGKPLTEEKKRQNRDRKLNVLLREKYNNVRQSLLNALDDKIFLAYSLGFMASQISGEEALHAPHQIPEYEEANEGSLLERIRNIDNRILDARLSLSTYVNTSKTLNRVLLGRGSEHLEPPEANTPGLFYRLTLPDSHSRYDKHLGFRSSRQPFTLPSDYEGPLHESLLVDGDSLRNQCEGDLPSDLIGMSDSPARIFNSIKGKDLRGGVIAVINVPKMMTMKVLFGRTTTLAQKLDMKTWAPSQKEGLEYANPNYWVAYRWIPAECIEFCIAVASLRSICEEYGIGEGNYDQRLSLEDFLQKNWGRLSVQDVRSRA